MVELMVLFVVLDVLFETVPDFDQYGLVHLHVVLLVLVVCLKHMVDRTLSKYLVVTFYLPQVAQAHTHTRLLYALTYDKWYGHDQALLYNQVYHIIKPILLFMAIFSITNLLTVCMLSFEIVEGK